MIFSSVSLVANFSMIVKGVGKIFIASGSRSAKSTLNTLFWVVTVLRDNPEVLGTGSITRELGIPTEPGLLLGLGILRTLELVGLAVSILDPDADPAIVYFNWHFARARASNSVRSPNACTLATLDSFALSHSIVSFNEVLLASEGVSAPARAD